MRIGDAKKLFDQYREDLTSDVNNVATLCRSQRVRRPLSNGSYLHALCLTKVMMKHTAKKFFMLTGSAADGFLTCLSREFEEMLGRLKSNGGKAQIIVMDKEGECEFLDALCAKYPGCLEVRFAQSTNKITHYIVADGDMVRDEQWHEPLSDEANADSVVADVYFHNENIAKMFEDRFNRQWVAIAA